MPPLLAGSRVSWRWAAWTVMAATLTELWSRLLLPPDAPARALRWRKPRRCAGTWSSGRGCAPRTTGLTGGRQLGRDVFRRGQSELSAANRGGDLTYLLRACLPALQVSEEQAVAFQPRPPPLWTASDALARVARLLAVLPDGSPLAAYMPTIPQDAPARCGAARLWPAP
jgi:hypothetical protein